MLTAFNILKYLKPCFLIYWDIANVLLTHSVSLIMGECSLKINSFYVCKTKKANMNMKLSFPKGQENKLKKYNSQQFVFLTYFV